MKLIPQYAESLRGCLNYGERYNSAAMCRVRPSTEEVWANLNLERKEPSLRFYSKAVYDVCLKVFREEFERQLKNDY